MMIPQRGGTDCASSFVCVLCFELVAICIVVLVFAYRAAGAVPTTRPGTPSTAPAASGGPADDKGANRISDDEVHKTEIAKWFVDLANADARMRESAKARLMELDRSDLPTVRNLVRDHDPLLPSQAVVLKEIVTQMYLASAVYGTNGREGFLGIRPAEVSIGMRPRDAQLQPPPVVVPNPGLAPGGVEFSDPNIIIGIAVMERMEGFAGARAFEDGDVIVGIVERPNVVFRQAFDFSTAVRDIGAGKKAHFQVLRQGQVIRVEAVLDPRPDAADSTVAFANPMQKLVADRKADADGYWDREFAPLLHEGAGS